VKYEIYSGAGNDFVMIDNMNGSITPVQQKEMTIELCRDRFPDIDGVIFADKPGNASAELMMSYYNRDGSFGAMCGNGARCVSMYAFNNGIMDKKKFTLEAAGDLYSAVITDEINVRIGFPEPKEIKQEINIKAEFGEGLKDMNVSYVNVGSDHIVVFMNNELNKSALGGTNIEALDVNYAGKILRYHNEFQPRGANVNFVLPVGVNKIRLRTYERGVERETLACGTGIVSSAICAVLKQISTTPVEVQVQSGEQLLVKIKAAGNMINGLSLEGSARKIDEGDIL
jgi:diaminopimelate epimerase